MLHDLLMRDPGFLPQILVRVPIMFVFTLLGVRLTGKRTIGQLSPFDFIMVLVSSSALGDSVLYRDVPLTHGMMVPALIFSLQYLLSALTLRSGAVETFVEGRATKLVEDGRMLERLMRQERISKDELFEGIRKQGLDDLGRVKAAYLERDGTISVIPRD